MEPKAIGPLLETVKAQLVKRDEDTPAMFRYKCLPCGDIGVENYLSPENPLAIYARPCKHCLAGQLKLKAWQKRKWQSNVAGRKLPIVWGEDDAALAEVMAYPCDHDGMLLRLAQEAYVESRVRAQAGPVSPEPEYPDP